MRIDSNGQPFQQNSTRQEGDQSLDLPSTAVMDTENYHNSSS